MIPFGVLFHLIVLQLYLTKKIDYKELHELGLAYHLGQKKRIFLQKPNHLSIYFKKIYSEPKQHQIWIEAYIIKR